MRGIPMDMNAVLVVVMRNVPLLGFQDKVTTAADSSNLILIPSLILDKF